MQNFPLNILTFPFWWYSVGLNLVWKWTQREYFFGLHKSGMLIFARHLGEPLYGDYTRTGRIFSFFLRIVLLVYKVIVFAIRLLIVGILDLLYLLLLPATIILIIFQIFALKNVL